jgi:hypothetical protein
VAIGEIKGCEVEKKASKKENDDRKADNFITLPIVDGKTKGEVSENGHKDRLRCSRLCSVRECRVF